MKGAARRMFQARMELTLEAYMILEAAATKVLARRGMIDQGFVTKDDLIDHCWEKVFFYTHDEKEMRAHLFVRARDEMHRYLDKYGPTRALSLEGDPELPPFDAPSRRELDNPAVAVEALDEWQHLPRQQRHLIVETEIHHRCLPRARVTARHQSIAAAVLGTLQLTRRERYLVRQCWIEGRLARQMGRELGVSAERIRQILRGVELRYETQKKFGHLRRTS